MKAPRVLTYVANVLDRHRHVAIALGKAESGVLRDLIDEKPIRAPIYINGLARSGSTMLLELIASHPAVATHRYRDFPFLCTPWWWNLAYAITPRLPRKPKERAHGDRILITPQSPEALEEMVWLMFRDSPDAFAPFYRDHIRKLMIARKRSRYAAKNNYNVARMSYLQQLFPDARFVLPVRDPLTHISSLMRQHERFTAAGEKQPRIALHMQLAGHQEFGLARRAMLTDAALKNSIEEAWQAGDEVRGWALLWHGVYSHAAAELEKNPALKSATLVLPFERLCQAPQASALAVLQHTGLEDIVLASTFAARIQAPEHRSAFTQAESNLIREITGKTAAYYGY